MIKWVIRFFGLRGSWRWACYQMDKGEIVRTKSSTGTVRYKLDSENQRRILWARPNRRDPKGNNAEWREAYIFLTDFEAVDWECV